MRIEAHRLRRTVLTTLAGLGLSAISMGDALALTLLQPQEISCSAPSAGTPDTTLQFALFYDDAAWVSYLYGQVVGRIPDPAEHQYWFDLLKSGTPRSSVTTGFLTSEQYCSNTVHALYSRILNREPDAAGLGYWTQTCQNGTDVRTIVAGFCGSEEYRATHPNGSASFLVENKAGRKVGYAINIQKPYGVYQNGSLESAQSATGALAAPPVSDYYVIFATTFLWNDPLRAYEEYTRCALTVPAVDGGFPLQTVKVTIQRGSTLSCSAALQ